MHSKRLTKAERVWLRGALIAELENKSGGHGWNKTTRELIARGMVKPMSGTFETISGGLELRYVLTPRGRACARQLWWTRLHGSRTPARGVFSAKSYNPLRDIPVGYVPSYFISFRA